MSIHRAAAGTALDRNPLFTPGPRLGWVFRDRSELAAPYAEPEPDPRAMAARLGAIPARKIRTGFLFASAGTRRTPDNTSNDNGDQS
jgi:hypothetical protein